MPGPGLPTSAPTAFEAGDRPDLLSEFRGAINPQGRLLDDNFIDFLTDENGDRLTGLN